MKFERITGLPQNMSTLRPKIITRHSNKIDAAQSAGFAAAAPTFLHSQTERNLMVNTSFDPSKKAFAVMVSGISAGQDAGFSDGARAVNDLASVVNMLHIEALKSQAFSAAAGKGVMRITLEGENAFLITAGIKKVTRIEFDISVDFETRPMPMNDLLEWNIRLVPIEDMTKTLGTRPHALILTYEQEMVRQRFLWSTYPELHRAACASAIQEDRFDRIIPARVSMIQLIELD